MNDRFRRFCYHIPEVKRYPTHLHCGLNGFPFLTNGQEASKHDRCCNDNVLRNFAFPHSSYKFADIRCGNQPFREHKSRQHLSNDNHYKVHKRHKGVHEIRRNDLLRQHKEKKDTGAF